MTSGMYTQMMDIREELREGSRDRRIPDDPVTRGGPRYGECGFPTWLGMLNISVYSASFILRRDIQTQKHILRACRELSRRKKTSYRRNFKFSDFSVRREGASDTLYPTEVLAQDGPGRVVPVARSLSQSPVAGSFGGFAGSTSMFCLCCLFVCRDVFMSSRPPASL